LVYHVVPGRNVPAAGDAAGVAQGYSTLGEALRAAGSRIAEPAAVRHEASHLDIVCTLTADPPSRASRWRKPRHAFSAYHQASGTGGDGTELTPWWSIPCAVDGLLQLDEQEDLPLRPGEHLRLVYREMFSPSAIEARKKIKETVAKYCLMAMAASLVVPLVAILGYLVIKAWPVLGPSLVLQNPHDFMRTGGIWAPLVGTFFLVLLSLLVAAPVGVLAGVYLNEYARDNWVTRIVNLAVMNLAGVPSIVHALFGVGAFVLFAHMGRSLLAASCTVAVMTLPVIITSTREALASVPRAFREACWNLGASRWQTIRTIVLPNSISGILTGVILQVSRAAGETAPILFTGAVFFTPIADTGWASWFPYSLHRPFMALSMHLFTLLTQVRGVSDEIQYGTAVVLIALVLAVNSLAIGLRTVLRSRKRW
jgi:phosphate transport system permease protein